MSIRDKINFVNEINQTLTKYQSNIISLEYRVFRNADDADWYKEFVLINYKGGARTIRNCTGNSYSAILAEIVAYLDHGRYDGEEYYHEFLDDPENWELLN